MNKSLLTHLVAFGLVGAGLLSPVGSHQVLAAGYFALAGAVTNWLAVYMLFEKIPFVVGSGVIPGQFEELKRGILKLIMGQFFTRAHIERFFRSPTHSGETGLDAQVLLRAVDHEAIYHGLMDVVRSSPLGGLLTLAGGESALAPLRRSFMERLKEIIRSVLQSEKIADILKDGFRPSRLTDEIMINVESIVRARLDELTPELVKEIVHEMIQKHLGWLVVWGGVFGGLIGLGTSMWW
jgi:uncharacterized membrane protein YheB (UPF0754 family)